MPRLNTAQSHSSSAINTRTILLLAERKKRASSTNREEKTAMPVQCFHNALLAAMLIAVVAASTSSRERRRAPGTHTDRPITLEELHFTVNNAELQVQFLPYPIVFNFVCVPVCLQCSVQPWTWCQGMITSLLNQSHSINVFISDCLTRHDPYEHSVPSPISRPALHSHSNISGECQMVYPMCYCNHCTSGVLGSPVMHSGCLLCVQVSVKQSLEVLSSQPAPALWQLEQSELQDSGGALLVEKRK